MSYIPMYNKQVERCYGEECLESIFCHQGARIPDLHLLTKRIKATVTIYAKHDDDDNHNNEKVQVDSETDDAFSTVFFKPNSLPAHARLLAKKQASPLVSFLSNLWEFVNRRQQHGGGGGGVDKNHVHVVYFSGYALSCVSLRPPAPSDHVEIVFETESAFSLENMLLSMVGLWLIVNSSWLLEHRAAFYVSSGLLGMGFALSVLILLLLFRTVSPTKFQFSVALLGQFSLVVFKDFFFNLVRYWDWAIVYYAVFTFSATIGFVHFHLARQSLEDSAVVDIVKWLVQFVGALCVLMSVPSPTWKVLLGVLVLLLIVYRNVSSAVESRPQPQQRQRQDNNNNNNSNMKTPLKPRLTEDEYIQLGQDYTNYSLQKLAQSPAFASWLERNMDRMDIKEE